MRSPTLREEVSCSQFSVWCRYELCYSSVQELSQLQDKHATRPDVFDDVEEEQEIEILTQEISQVQVS